VGRKMMYAIIVVDAIIKISTVLLNCVTFGCIVVCLDVFVVYLELTEIVVRIAVELTGILLRITAAARMLGGSKGSEEDVGGVQGTIRDTSGCCCSCT
jgi:hypothetical protein